MPRPAASRGSPRHPLSLFFPLRLITRPLDHCPDSPSLISSQLFGPRGPNRSWGDHWGSDRSRAPTRLAPEPIASILKLPRPSSLVERKSAGWRGRLRSGTGDPAAWRPRLSWRTGFSSAHKSGPMSTPKNQFVRCSSADNLQFQSSFRLGVVGGDPLGRHLGRCVAAPSRRSSSGSHLGLIAAEHKTSVWGNNAGRAAGFWGSGRSTISPPPFPV